MLQGKKVFGARLKKGGKWGIAAILLLLLVIIVCDRIIVCSADEFVYEEISRIPVNRVGLLLGTSPKLKNGKPNLFFRYRIEAAAELYRSRKISRILVSGDNRKRNYNEPEEMRRALVACGIPDSVIVLDYAGMRTLDSVVRAKKVFGQRKITIISQRFHTERALYIAAREGIEAVGYTARDVDMYSGVKTCLRERLARVKVFMDLLSGKGPRYLGEPIEIR